MGDFAINKFDSDRKRMSILLRSPPELGSLPILLRIRPPEICSGAAATGDLMSSLMKRPASINDRGRESSALSTLLFNIFTYVNLDTDTFSKWPMWRYTVNLYDIKSTTFKKTFGVTDLR